MKNNKQGSALAGLLVVIAVVVIGAMVYFYSQNIVEEDNQARFWTNSELNYQFTYPPEANVEYAKETSDGACAFVNINGNNFLPV